MSDERFLLTPYILSREVQRIGADPEKARELIERLSPVARMLSLDDFWATYLRADLVF